MSKPSIATGFTPGRKIARATSLAFLAAIPLFAAGCVLDGDSERSATTTTTAAPGVDASAAPARQDHITLSAEGFEPDAVEVDEGATVRVTNNTDDPMTVIVSGGDSDTEFEIPPQAEIEISMESAGARVITVPGDAGLTATIMVRPAPTEDSR